MNFARLAFLAAATVAIMSAPASAQKTSVTLATATPGGGFPLFGDNAAAVINETDASLDVRTQNTKGSAENIGLLEDGKIDIALVAGEPAYEAFMGIGRAPTSNKIIAAIYSNPGMFVVRGDSPAKTLRDLVGKPIAWGTRASGLTLLGRYVTNLLYAVPQTSPAAQLKRFVSSSCRTHSVMLGGMGGSKMKLVGQSPSK